MSVCLRLGSACGLLACIVLLMLPLPAAGQPASSFRYVIPQFNGTSGSAVVLTNLSTVFVTADIRFYNINGAVLTTASVAVPPGLQRRLASTSFRPGEGTLVVQSSGALSITATIANPNGSYENIAPAPEAVNAIVPFSFGNASKVDITLANSFSLPTKALLRSFSVDGTPLNTVERSIPAFGSLTEAVSSLFPQSMAAGATSLGSIGILAETNVLTEERRLAVQARIRDYSDPAFLTASTLAPPSGNLVLPLFLHGGGFISTIEVMNPSTKAATISVQGFDSSGRLLFTGSPLQLAPNAAMRNDVQTLLRLQPGSASGSIVFNSDVPIIVTETIANPTRGGMLVTTAVEASTNFAFSQRKPPLRASVSLTIANQNSTPARLKLRSINADGVTVAQVAVTVNPLSSLSRSFAEFLSDDQIDGTLYVSSDVPVFVSALESNSDSSLLATLPGTHSEAGYEPPTPSLFRITGTVRRSAGVVPGVKVQVQGPMNLAALSDTSGKYTLRVVPGQYGVEAADPSYVFNPPARSVGIVDADSIGNDFEGALIGPSPKPTLVAISPAATDIRPDADAPPLVLEITGSEFRPGARVLLGKTALSTQFNTSTSLTAWIPASSLLAGGSFDVSVENPSPSLGVSRTVQLQVINAAPVLASVEPESPSIEPGLPVSITLHGENFSPNSVFELTPPCAAIYVANRLDAQTAVLSINAQCAGTYYARVKTPAPGGGASQTVSVNVR